jgi:hypothetical protein
MSKWRDIPANAVNVLRRANLNRGLQPLTPGTFGLSNAAAIRALILWFISLPLNAIGANEVRQGSDLRRDHSVNCWPLICQSPTAWVRIPAALRHMKTTRFSFLRHKRISDDRETQRDRSETSAGFSDLNSDKIESLSWQLGRIFMMTSFLANRIAHIWTLYNKMDASPIPIIMKLNFPFFLRMFNCRQNRCRYFFQRQPPAGLWQNRRTSRNWVT